MKKVEAIIRHSRIETVKEVLSALGFTGMTLIEIEGLGHQEGHVEFYRGVPYQIDFVPKIKLEILVEDEDVDTVIQHLAAAARTGKIGDGKIIVTPVERIIRIRTAEENKEAL